MWYWGTENIVFVLLLLLLLLLFQKCHQPRKTITINFMMSWTLSKMGTVIIIIIYLFYFVMDFDTIDEQESGDACELENKNKQPDDHHLMIMWT